MADAFSGMRKYHILSILSCPFFVLFTVSKLGASDRHRCNCRWSATFMTELSLPEFVQTQFPSGGLTGPQQHLDGNKPLATHLRKECMSWLFSENLPLTPSGKIKKTPASQLTEWVTVEGKNPRRVTPWIWRSFRNFLANSLHLFLYGCTRGIYGLFDLCLSKSKTAFSIKLKF